MSIRRVVPDIASEREAARRGARILFPPRDESWGVRRFFLLDPNDVVINVMSHGPGRPAES